MAGEARAALYAELGPHWSRVHRPMLDELLQAHARWRAQARQDDAQPSGEDVCLSLLRYLPLHMHQARERLNQLHRAAASFGSRYSRAGSDRERQQHVLSLARALGASGKALRQDEQALNDWFGADAVKERYQRLVAREERRLALCLDRLAALCAPLMREQTAMLMAQWRSLDLHRALLQGMQHAGEERVRLAAFEALDRILRQLNAADAEALAGRAILQASLRAAVDWHGSVWLQAAALSVLSRVSISWLCQAIRRRFSYSGSEDEMFLRARAVTIMCRVYDASPEIRGLLSVAANDSSAHVRQCVADGLAELPDTAIMDLLPTLVHEDGEPAVRAAALLSLPALQSRPALRPVCLGVQSLALKSENDSFVLKVALLVCAQVHARLVDLDPGAASLWQIVQQEHLQRLHQTHPVIAVRRMAASTSEQLWAQSTPQRLDALRYLRQHTPALRCGRSIELDIALPTEELCRLLAVLGQQDCGFEILPRRKGFRLRKHDRFGWRFWRFLHETRHPASDKRQAFSHTSGRHYSSPWQAQSSIMAEMSETKVPAEPLFIDSEGSWRPYLPLLDQVISACGLRGRPMRLYSSEGLTEIVPPRRLLARLSSRLRISWRAADLARLRNWQEDDGHSAGTYAEALAEHGIRLRFTPHLQAEEPSADSSVRRFFPATLAIIPPQLIEDFSAYFVSLYQNSLRELIAFLGAMSVLFFGRHIWVNQRIRQYRRRLPLSIGGWGTRGKSGSERLKAALFNALGYNTVSKTTGCEAMFVHSHAYGQPRELFLFRPYDKASIWEQVDVMRMAGALGCEVFLWECMALTPSFVYTLQREWMKDDLATICNAYPDHEDLQGPAGINIPQVMQNFVPRSSTLITTEEQMLPFLLQEAEQQNTRSVQAGWLQAGLITPDLLARFPYEEHPYNMALVCAMAAELGISRDYALKEMADNVIPDLGVLKVYPTAAWRSRRLEFVMGMSANERLGCMSNWKRMGFASHDPSRTPGVWTSSVINNRADRIARSKVFAAIVVKDISADRHVLIGSNLDGFRAYMREAFEEIEDTLSLWPDGDTDTAPLDILRQQASRRRIPTDRAEISRRLTAMLEGLGASSLVDRVESWLEQPEALQQAMQAEGLDAHAAEVNAQLKRDLDELRQFKALADAVQASPQASDALDQRYRAEVWRWIEAQLIVIEDPLSTGDQIIETICASTPPGFRNRIMGLQNIKGTGLGFVYAWQAWDACARACAQLLTACWDDAPAELQQCLQRYRPTGLRSGDLSQAEIGLRTLAAFQEYNPLCAETVRAVCNVVAGSAAAQSELFQSDIQTIGAALEQQLQLQQQSRQNSGHPGLMTRLLNLIESALDAGDAIRRRRNANRIYRALCDQRISTARAALELQKLTKRQKGGWFVTAARRAEQRLQQRLRVWFKMRPPATVESLKGTPR